MKKLLLGIMMLISVGACKPDATIQGNEYRLNDTPEDVEITLGFAPVENRFFGKAVNRYFGTYKIEGNQLKLGPVGSTMMMGPETAMNAEQQYFQDLSHVNTFQVTEDTLTLKLSDNKTLTFRKIGTVK